jgi:hypothetical protein
LRRTEYIDIPDEKQPAEIKFKALASQKFKVPAHEIQVGGPVKLEKSFFSKIEMDDSKPTRRRK